MFRNTTHNIIAIALAGTLASGCMTTDMDDDMDMADTQTRTTAGTSTDTVMVGGAEMSPTRNIIENASDSRIHATLVAAVQAAGLTDTLSSPGPFTVFAPTDSAFAKLPAGTLNTLFQPANKGMLTDILTYHVVSGNVTASDLMRMINAGGGSATLNTVQGGTLTARMMNGNVVLVDAKGGTSTVTQADVMQSNGVIHVTDTVSMPM